MSILPGDFSLFWRLRCYDLSFPCQTQHGLVNIVEYELALLFTKDTQMPLQMQSH